MTVDRISAEVADEHLARAATLWRAGDAAGAEREFTTAWQGYLQQRIGAIVGGSLGAHARFLESEIVQSVHVSLMAHLMKGNDVPVAALKRRVENDVRDRVRRHQVQRAGKGRPKGEAVPAGELLDERELIESGIDDVFRLLAQDLADLADELAAAPEHEPKARVLRAILNQQDPDADITDAEISATTGIERTQVNRLRRGIIRYIAEQRPDLLDAYSELSTREAFAAWRVADES
jgi:hypothetical protein